MIEEQSPTAEQRQAQLADLKARQQSGQRLLCPRCGRNTTVEPLQHNDLSRQADIMVCRECGLSEALEAMAEHKKPLSEWACFSTEHR